VKIKQIPEQFENEWMTGCPYQGISMEDNEVRFINGIIREIKPKKLLEIGVHSGCSSILMLNAIKDDSAAHLYSVDYARHICYGVTYARGWKNYQGPDNEKKIGYLVKERTPQFINQWSLFTGGHVAEFIEGISGGGGGGVKQIYLTLWVPKKNLLLI
jgi:hypothetical protein